MSVGHCFNLCAATANHVFDNHSLSVHRLQPTDQEFVNRLQTLLAVCLQVASCERTCLPTGEAAAKVQRILKEQDSFESAMRVTRLGSRTGSRPVRKSFGQSCMSCHSL